MRKRTERTVELVCVDCGARGRFHAASPAAPTLTACESARKVGWSYVIGFFAMLTDDHEPRCPDCTSKRRAEKAAAVSAVSPKP